MDDLDDFFGNDAVDAFVSGMDFNQILGAHNGNEVEAQEARAEFVEALLENDGLIYSTTLGPDYEKHIKDGMYRDMEREKIIDLIYLSSLAGPFYPKDQKTIDKQVEQNGKEKNFDEKDMLEVTKQLLLLNLDAKPTSKT